MTKRKILRTLLPVGITLIFAAGYYYYAPPAFNFHDPELWWFLIVLCAIYGVLRLIFGHRTLIENGKPTWKGFLGFAAAAVLFVSSPGKRGAASKQGFFPAMAIAFLTASLLT